MYPSTPMQYNKYKTILEQVSHPQEATVNTINEPTKSTTTLDYYNKNAKKFITGTISVDFGTIQNRFLDKLHPGAEILDYGCGSGRDIKYFLEQGCKVTAIDGSQELCKLASEYTGIPVKHLLFQDLDEKEVYDGIWACSSILHVALGLDDVVITYMDGHKKFVQVKHTRANDTLTFGDLVTIDTSNVDANSHISLLGELAKSWNEEHSKYSTTGSMM